MRGTPPKPFKKDLRLFSGRLVALLNFAWTWDRASRLDILYCKAHVRFVKDVTHILEAAQKGDVTANEKLLPLVYDELRKLAALHMAKEAPGHTLQPTALVHEVWLRLLKPEEQARFENRAHFFGAAAEAMRRILIESARRKKRIKRGGDFERVGLDAIDVPLPMDPDEFLALDAALDRLAMVNPRAAQVVKLCFFVGVTQEMAAKELCISVSTVERLWSGARAWLFNEINKTEPADADS
jgi:RNA polymerase sigma factor (TIGR02999 family)